MKIYRMINSIIEGPIFIWLMKTTVWGYFGLKKCFFILTGTSGLVNTLSSSFFSLGGTGTHSLSVIKRLFISYCPDIWLKNGAKSNFIHIAETNRSWSILNWENIHYQYQQEILYKATWQEKETGDVHILLHIIRHPMNFLGSFIWHCPKHLL